MLPIWVYFAVAGIIFSAYMTVRTSKEDRQVTNESIELEGRVYMERIEQEKERRKTR